jgi:hypothetical protein
VSFGRFHYRWSILAPALLLLLFLSSSASASIIVLGLEYDSQSVELDNDNSMGSHSHPPIDDKEERIPDDSKGLRPANRISNGSNQTSSSGAVAPASTLDIFCSVSDVPTQLMTDCYKLLIPVRNPRELLKVPISVHCQVA